MTQERAPGKIITFYSYKGGTGRSMALANIAWILATNGHRVMAIDWDLEAPGLHRYFYPYLLDKDLMASDGVIDLVSDFAIEAVTPRLSGEPADEQWYWRQANVTRVAAALDWNFPEGGALHFIPPGRQGKSYSTRVNSFNWQNFYDRLGGGAFLEAVRNRLKSAYDYVLIDSRTGISDTSGICTVQMPDSLAVCFTLNAQSIEGAAAVAESVKKSRSEPEFQVFPIPCRVELAEKDRLEKARDYAQRKFAGLIDHVPASQRQQYWNDVEVLYYPYYAYEEVLATFRDKSGERNSLLGSMERITACLTGGKVTRLGRADRATAEVSAGASSSGVSLVITMVDVYGHRLDETVDLAISQADTEQRLFFRNLAGSRSVAITGLPTASSGIYDVQILPKRYRPRRSFVRLEQHGPTKLTYVFTVDRDSVVGAYFPPYASLPAALRKSLENVSGEVRGERFYDALDDLSKANLLNVVAKMSSTVIGEGRNLFSFVEGVFKVGANVAIFIINPALSGLLREASMLFREAPATLHNPPRGYSRAACYRGTEPYGTLQLTFFEKTDAPCLAAADIDISTGIEHTFEVVRGRQGPVDDPYSVQQLLIFDQKIDPGYTLRLRDLIEPA